MNLSKKLPLIITVILIGLSLFSVFEERALFFVSDVYKKNVSFLALTTEIKLVMAGLSSMNIPFIAGYTSDLNVTIEKVQEFLLLTNVISFLQVILISISKSWILKIITLVLFGLCFLKKTKVISSKILLLSLALNPGLILFSVGVQQLSQEASIDYGGKYLEKLKASVHAGKLENAKLMKQHASDLAKIHNGQKGIQILNEFKEAISYDFKKVKSDIKGANANIRLLIHEGGHELTTKLFGFGSMIIFNMVILPIGYVLLIYILFNSLFKTKEMELAENPLAAIKNGASNVNKPTFKGKLNNLFKTYLEEFHSIPKTVDQSSVFQNGISNIEELEGKIVSKAKAVDHEKEDTLKSEETKELATLKEEAEDKISQVKTSIKEEVNPIKHTVNHPENGESTPSIKKNKPQVLSI